jgi:hypothetical protein
LHAVVFAGWRGASAVLSCQVTLLASPLLFLHWGMAAMYRVQLYCLSLTWRMMRGRMKRSWRHRLTAATTQAAPPRAAATSQAAPPRSAQLDPLHMAAYPSSSSAAATATAATAGVAGPGAAGAAGAAKGSVVKPTSPPMADGATSQGGSLAALPSLGDAGGDHQVTLRPLMRQRLRVVLPMGVQYPYKHII